MARTVDVGSTFENWRQNYNNLATDVGDPVALTTVDKTSVVNAINYIMDQYFFFQDFDFDGSDGDSSNTVFPGSAMSGLDNAGNTFQYKPQKVLVYKNGLLLRSGTDYTAINGTTITLAASANNGDVIRVSSYTGSYTNTPSGAESQFYWQTAGSNVYNNNDAGIVLQTGRSIANIVTAPTVTNSIQLDGDTYVNADLYLNAQKDLRFRDSDSSHYVAVQAPGTVSTNRTLTLPSAEDGYMLAVAAVGSNGQVLSSDGDGSYSWTNVSNTNTTYSTSWVDSGDNAILRLTPSTGSADDLTIVAGSGITVTPSGDNLTIVATATLPTAITVADESSDTTCFPAFFTAATGDLGPKTGDNLTFNSSSGVLTATGFAGPITGNVTGNVTGSSATVTGASQGSITTLANLVTVGTIGTGVWQGSSIAQAYLTGQSGTNTGDQSSVSGNAGTATALATGRTIGMTGDVVWTSASFTGSGNVTGTSVIQTDAVDIAMLSASGTANSSTFLRGDNTWASPADANTWRGVTAGGNTLSSSETLAFTAGTNVSITESGGAVTINSTDQYTGTSNLALGSSSSTAYRGDRGTTAYDHSQATHAPSGAEVNVQSDWNSGSGDAHILNKPTIISVGSGSGNAHRGDHGATAYTHSQATHAPTNATANAGTVTSIATGVGISGGTITSSGTLTNTGVTSAVAGSNITVSGATGAVTIAATDTTYSAGSGIGLSSTTFSVAVNASGVSSGLIQDANGISLGLTPTFTTVAATGDITAFASSDIALKENIINIPNPLEKLSKIGGYMFDWKKDHKVEGVLGEGHDTGILAQEIEEILPEIVELRKTGIKAVNYMKLIPLLVESIKELKTELDDLKSSNS